MRRSSRKRKDVDAENENDPEVLELNRAVKRLNTGDVANRARANGGDGVGGRAPVISEDGKARPKKLPLLDENYETYDDEDEKREEEKTNARENTFDEQLGNIFRRYQRNHG